MLAPTIEILSRLDAQHSRNAAETPSEAESMLKDRLHTEGLASFRAKYGRLDIGWHFAGRFATTKRRFPMPMTGRDYWVFVAYLMRSDPSRFYNENIADAYHIESAPHSCANIRSTIRSLILTYVDGTDHKVHLNSVANAMHIPYATVEAYEVLFFNILDRRLDSIHIANNLYPHPGGRLIEFSESYFRDSQMGQLLERVGHNYRKFDLSKYLAGLGDRSYLAQLAASEDRESDLTNQIMGNGLLLSKAGLLNHRSPGWGRAATLLTAARAAGGGTEQPPLMDVGPMFAEQLEAVSRINADAIAKGILADEAEIVAVDDED